MYTCIYTYTHIYIYIYICMYTCIYTYESICVLKHWHHVLKVYGLTILTSNLLFLRTGKLGGYSNIIQHLQCENLFENRTDWSHQIRTLPGECPPRYISAENLRETWDWGGKRWWWRWLNVQPVLSKGATSSYPTYASEESEEGCRDALLV